LEIFPLDLDANEEEKRYQFSCIYAHFVASLILDYTINPNRISRKKKKTTPSEPRERPINYLNDHPETEKIQQRFYDEYIEENARREEEGLLPNKMLSIDRIEEILDDFEIEEHRYKIKENLVNLGRRKIRNIQYGILEGKDIVSAGFDEIRALSLLDAFKFFGSKLGGLSSFRKLKNALASAYDRAWEQNYAAISKLKNPPAVTHRLYWWLTHNKVLHAKGEIRQDRYDRLSDIPWWTWQETFEERWESRFDMIKTLEL
jgi:hypothetical protein